MSSEWPLKNPVLIPAAPAGFPRPMA